MLLETNPQKLLPTVIPLLHWYRVRGSKQCDGYSYNKTSLRFIKLLLEAYKDTTYHSEKDNEEIYFLTAHLSALILFPFLPKVPQEQHPAHAIGML